MVNTKINIALLGVGNCASSLVQGLQYYSETKTEDGLISDVIGGYKVEDIKANKNLFYAPGLGVIEDHVLEYMSNADVVLIDGTVWTNDEMSKHGINDKLASEMGHLDQSSKGGIMETLSNLKKPRKILIHINNTNPILNEDSKEREILNSHNIEVSYDGMDIII